MLLSAATEAIASRKKPPAYVAPVIATVVSIFIFAWVITVGIDSLEKAITECWKQQS
jgi:hypothetical protein